MSQTFSLASTLSYITIILYGGEQVVRLLPWVRPLLLVVYLAVGGLLLHCVVITMRRTVPAEHGTVVSLGVVIGGFGTLGYIMAFSSQYLLPGIVILLLQGEPIIARAIVYFRQRQMLKFFGVLSILGLSSYWLVFPDGQIHFAVYPDRVFAALAAIASAALYAGYTVYTWRVPAPLSNMAAVTARTIMACLTVMITALYSPWKVYEQTTVVVSNLHIGIMAVIIIGCVILLAFSLRRARLDTESNHQTSWNIVGFIAPLVFLLNTGRQAVSVTQWVGYGILVSISIYLSSKYEQKNNLFNPRRRSLHGRGIL